MFDSSAASRTAQEVRSVEVWVGVGDSGKWRGLTNTSYRRGLGVELATSGHVDLNCMR